jgi:hypothetical protein
MGMDRLTPSRRAKIMELYGLKRQGPDQKGPPDAL